MGGVSAQGCRASANTRSSECGRLDIPACLSRGTERVLFLDKQLQRIGVDGGRECGGALNRGYLVEPGRDVQGFQVAGELAIPSGAFEVGGAVAPRHLVKP